jgi:hypothetical protein
MEKQSQKKDIENAKTQLGRVWEALHRAVVAIDKVSRELEVVAAHVERPDSISHERQQPNCRAVRRPNFCFHDEGAPDLQRMVSVIIERHPGRREIFQKPAELLAVARTIGAFSRKIANTEPCTDKERRAESAAIGRYCELHKGKTFNVRRTDDKEIRIKFEAIGQGKTRQYRLSECE